MVEPNREMFANMDGGETFIVGRVRRAMADMKHSDASKFCDKFDELIASMFASCHAIEDVKERADYSIQQLQIMIQNLKKVEGDE